jgi:hypothetical protein
MSADKTHIFKIRFAEKEMDILREEAKRRNLPISFIIRDGLDSYFEQTDYDKKHVWVRG